MIVRALGVEFTVHVPDLFLLSHDLTLCQLDELAVLTLELALFHFGFGLELVVLGLVVLEVAVDAALVHPVGLIRELVDVLQVMHRGRGVNYRLVTGLVAVLQVTLFLYVVVEIRVDEFAVLLLAFHAVQLVDDAVLSLFELVVHAVVVL